MDTKEIEYIFDLIISELNLVLFNDTQNQLMAFKRDCYAALDRSKMINMFHKNTLLSYDTSLRLFANIIFEKIPNERDLELTQMPEFEEFQKWFAQLEFDDFVLLCFFLKDQLMLELKNSEDLQFIINVFITNKGFSNAKSNPQN